MRKPSPKRVPLAVVEQVFALCREMYFDLNVRHFHEKLQGEHQIRLSYTWVKKALQERVSPDATFIRYYVRGAGPEKLVGKPEYPTRKDLYAINVLRN